MHRVILFLSRYGTGTASKSSAEWYVASNDDKARKREMRWIMDRLALVRSEEMASQLLESRCSQPWMEPAIG